MNLKKLLLTTVIIALFGCGSESSTNKSESLLPVYYEEKSGDILSFERISVTTYSPESLGTIRNNYLLVSTYSDVQTIPDKYNYSQPGEGPFILETQTKNGELNSLRFSDTSGNRIISDNLSQFTNSDYTVSTGSEEQTNINIGDIYNFQSKKREFDSTSSEDVGYSTISMTIEIIGTERIQVLAGSFDSVKLSYTTEVIDAHEIDGTFNTSGNMWYEAQNGHMLKMTDSGVFTIKFPDFEEITGEYQSILQAKNINIIDTGNVESRSITQPIITKINPTDIYNIANEIANNTAKSSVDIITNL